MKEDDSAAGSLSRRRFLAQTLIGVSAFVCGNALAIPPPDAPRKIQQRELHLINDNTREKLDVIYWKDGAYVDDILGQLHYLLRDHHTGKAALIDPKLYDFLYQLQENLDTTERIHVLSGYRTPETNAYLRKTSLGVARNSYHTKGQAVDIYIPGVDANVIQKAARKLRMGGVGYYSKAGFVHLDTGYARHWSRG
ncbi:MAG: DUF882 domain-containing protein [Granulosicoccus sp.]|nr:DUF882 domain-containing protein [Granulosicoccus sp.]